jgi:D-alanine-D-alanine ligase
VQKKKLRVGVLFGGRSGEHEVSLLSAASILKAMDRERFEVVEIGITKAGRWVTAGAAERLLTGGAVESLQAGSAASGDAEAGSAGKSESKAKRGAKGKGADGKRKASGDNLRAGDPAATEMAAVLARGEAVLMPPVPAAAMVPFETERAQMQAGTPALQVDVIFPVLHGTFGEDGTVQGLLELAGLPYVGSGVLGSATGMDKDIMKRLFAAAGLPIVPQVTLLRGELKKSANEVTKRIERKLKYPLFVKPANLGSSVGVSKAHDRAELLPALKLAAKYDRKIVVEEGVGGKHGKARELEVAVLGNDDPEASVVGEIVPGKEFYDYEAKYLSEGSEALIPAPVPAAIAKKVRAMAIEAFKACDCAGLARVDFLMDPASKQVFVNEINTMPGFTSISMYPKLWEASGLKYGRLITRLIALAMERAAERKKNLYSL